MKPEQKPFQFSIDDGPTFFADEISIMDNEHKFFFDFKNQSPRNDVRANEAIPIVIKHSSIILDPALAKVFAKLLTEHVATYEKNHGTIPELKLSVEQPGKPNITRIKDDRPEYFG